MYEENTVLVAANESSYGTDATPGPTDAILISNLRVVPGGNALKRNNYRGTKSPSGVRIGQTIYTVTFDVDIRGDGSVPSAADPAEFNAIMLACGLTVDYTATYAEYSPVSDATNDRSVTMECNFDGIEYKLTGGVGNVQLAVVAGEFAKLSFEFQGKYNDPSDQALPTPTFTNNELPPICESMTFTINDYAARASAINVNLGNVISRVPDLNSDEGLYGLRITKREGTFGVDPEAVLLATNNFYTLFKASTEFATVFTIGSVSGNQVKVRLPAAQLTAVNPDTRDGINIFNIEAELTGDDDEFKFRML